MNRKPLKQYYSQICITLLLTMIMGLLPINGTKNYYAAEMKAESIDRISSPDGIDESEREISRLMIPAEEERLGKLSVETNIQVDASFETHIYNALMREEKEIDIQEFRIPSSEVYQIYYKILTYHPDLFHVSNMLNYKVLNEYATHLIPNYALTGEALQQKRDTFNKEVEKVKAVVQPWMTDLEIALVVNDYLALHIDYDIQGPSPYTAYGALVDRRAVCDGYARAYLHLMRNVFDIPTEYVLSEPMNHAWNMVLIDGEYYHVDVTWNDPTNGSFGMARHEYFLVSDEEFRNRGHYDWKSSVTAENTRFDNAFWTAVDAPFARILDAYYYVDSVSQSLMKWDYKTDTKTVIQDLRAYWYYGGSFSKVYAVRGNLYYSMPDGFYKINSDGSGKENIYTPEQKTGYYPYGFRVDDETFRFVYSDYPLKKENDVLKQFSPPLNPAVTEILISKALNMNIGEEKTLAVEVRPAEADTKGLLWISSNPKVVSVKAGTLTAHSEGTASVTVYTANGDRKGTTEVTVGRVLSGIDITALPAKTKYIQGESLDLSGLKVEAVFSDNSREGITITKDMITGFNSSTPAVGQIVTITYKGFKDTFKVDVIENALQSIEITTLPGKLNYYIGERLDLTGMIITGIYLDGSRKVLDVTKSTAEGFNSTVEAENQEITVRYEDKTDSFMVNVIKNKVTDVSITSYPSKRVYDVGESLDLWGLELKATYQNGHTEKIDLSNIQVTGFDSSAPQSDQTVTIVYDQWRFEYKVDILMNQAVEVIAGANRYRTAVSISEASYTQAETVILVQANNFPDALAAGPLAYMMDAPILLTSTTALSSSVQSEIKRLQARKIIIMGGYSAVSENVEKTLKSEGYTVERIEGSNRYATAVGTAQFMQKKLGGRKTVVLASGEQFADALAAGSYAAKEGHPILLTDGRRLTKTTMEYIKNNGIQTIIIVGGSSVVEETLETQLKGIGLTIMRKSGKNRFETSLEIAKNYFNESENAIIANGMEFADALAAAPYAAKINAPILLVNHSRINLAIKEYLPGSKINKIVVVGGDAAVSESVQYELKELIE